MKSLDEFQREFYDELLGIAVRPNLTNDEAARGLFIRERCRKITELMGRMHAYITEAKLQIHKAETNEQTTRRQSTVGTASGGSESNGKPAARKEEGQGQRPGTTRSQQT